MTTTTVTSPVTSAGLLTSAGRPAGAPVADAPVADAPVADAPVADAPVADAPVSGALVTGAPSAAAPATAAPATAAPTLSPCSIALAYLAAHAKPGFEEFCRPGTMRVGITGSVAYTCMPGATFRCPDGAAEIIIADPTCATSYENEASNSWWDFASGGQVSAGAVQDGRVWDPYGECP